MLERLFLSSFLLARQVAFEPGSGLCVLTGETGAGKSILVDALALLLGGRWPGGAGACRLEASWTPSPSAQLLLEQWGMAADESLVLRRVVDQHGKSRSFINAQSASLGQLESLGASLVELYGQHTQQVFTQEASLRRWVDEAAQLGAQLQQLKQAFDQLKQAQAALAQAQQQSQQQQHERQHFERIVEDLQALAPKPGQWEQLSQRHSLAAHQQEHSEALTQVLERINRGPQAISQQLSGTVRQLGRLEHPQAQQALALLEEALGLVQEAESTLDRALSAQLEEPSSLAELEQQLGHFYEMSRKWRVEPEQLAGLWQQALAALDEEGREHSLQQLSQALAQAEAHYLDLAQALDQQRRLWGEALLERVKQLLLPLALPQAQLEWRYERLSEATSHGMTRMSLWFCSHPSLPLQPLAKSASGGELSRLALALLVASGHRGSDSVDTVVFDEIDNGVGGQVAHQLGRLLRQLADGRQVLCVTHLPQIASAAHHHYKVSKHEDDNGVFSQLIQLDAQQRQAELARMLGGSPATALLHAQALLAEQG